MICVLFNMSLPQTISSLRAEIIIGFFTLEYSVTSMMAEIQKAPDNVLNRRQIELHGHECIIRREKLIYSILYSLVEITCLLKMKPTLALLFL